VPPNAIAISATMTAKPSILIGFTFASPFSAILPVDLDRARVLRTPVPLIRRDSWRCK
jgi:hypothetical protein